MTFLRPAHSLPKLGGAVSLSAGTDPAFGEAVAGCLDAGVATPCAAPASVPLDVAYRLGLGHGWEIGSRGFPIPRALAVKYAVLDERRHPTPVSVALEGEGGVTLRLEEAGLAALPFARGDLVVSGTLRLGPGVALRPAGSLGYWMEPMGGAVPVGGPGYTAGLFVPVRLPADLAFSPSLGVSGFFPPGTEPVHALRVGVTIASWLPAQSPGG